MLENRVPAAESVDASPNPGCPHRPDHGVHFYENDDSLFTVVSKFLLGGIEAGQHEIVIATPAHTAALLRKLGANDTQNWVDSQSRILFLDAEETLSKFMVGGMPDDRLFAATVGALIEQHLHDAAGAGVRAYGEMVDVLWKADQREAAIRLEELWHRLAERHPFSLLCAYAMGQFYGESRDSLGAADVCRTHSYVVPPAVTGGDEGQRRLAATVNERRAELLEAEIAHRRELEVVLRGVLAERSRAETSLRETEQELRDFLENAVDGMHSVAADGKILWANAAELTMLGYTADEYVGHDIAEFHADAAVLDDILARLRRNETLHNYPAQMKRKDGTLRDVLINSSVLWRGGEFVHTRCITRDVTEQIHIERQRTRAARQLAAEHAVTKLLADSTPFEQVIPELLRTVGEVGDWQAGSLWTPDETVAVLRCTGFWHSESCECDAFEQGTLHSVFSRGTGMPGEIWETGEPMWIEDVAAHPNFPRAWLAHGDGLHSAIGFPVRVRGRITGVLEFFSRDVRQADQDVLQLFSVVGTQIGHFIERREVEEMRERLAAIVDSSDDAIVSKTLDGVIRSWNRGAEQIFGYTAAEAVGRHITLIVPDDRLDEEADVLARLSRGEKIDHYETIRQTKDGRRLNMSLTVSPVRNADGRIIGASKVARDITAAKRSAADLAESERRFRILADSAPVLIWVTGPDGGCEFANKFYVDFFGVPFDQLKGSGWTSYLHPDDAERCLTAYNDAITSRAPFRAEMRLRRHDGQYRWVESYGLPHMSASGELLGYVGVSPDITARKDSEEMLKKSVTARDEFLSTASHELRNPLNALQLQLTALQRAAREGGDMLPKDWVCDRVEQATEDVGTLVRLVHNLLDVARITAGRMDVEPEDLDFARVICDVLNRFTHQLSSQPLKLDVKSVPGRSDRLRLEQVITNLVSNAIKYGAGKPIEVALAHDGDAVRLTVKDHGIGIRAEDRAHLFKRFSRAVPRRQYGGFGLGLWITGETVRAMGGDISVESTPGEGSTFTVSLPRILTTQIEEDVA
jgi:PAS domain S-box-containing protein